MKLKIVVIDLEVPPRVKRWGFRIGIPLGLLLGGGAIAWAAGLHTWANGDTLNATDLNGNFSNLQSEITALQGEVHPASGFRAYLTSASTTLSAASGNTQLKFDHTEYDSNSEYDPASGTFSPKQAGVYWLGCSFVSPDTTFDLAAAIVVNGAFVANSTSRSATTGIGANPAISTTAQLAPGDSVTCLAVQASGATHPIQTGVANHFGAARIY